MLDCYFLGISNGCQVDFFIPLNKKMIINIQVIKLPVSQLYAIIAGSLLQKSLKHRLLPFAAVVPNKSKGLRYQQEIHQKYEMPVQQNGA